MSNYNPNPITSNIPGTQAHREKKFAEHEQGAAFGVTGGAHLNAPGAGYTNVPANPTAAGYGPGATTGFQGPGVGAQTGVHPAPATMSERADELQGRHHHQGATTGMTSAGTGMTSAGTAKPHLGDRVMGATQAAVGRAINNPALEQAGLERKTFGDPKHRPGGVGATAPATGAGYGTTGMGAPVQQQGFQQGFAGNQPAQQAYTQPGAGTAFQHHAPPAGPPPGAY